MKTPVLTVCLSPKLTGLQDFRGKVAVVVDILRASTTIVTALAHGVKSVLPVESVKHCRELTKKGYIGAAERKGKVVEGFELGNSPFDFMNPGYAGKKIAFTTTNGTKTIFSITGADKIILGAFVNIMAVSRVLKKLNKDTVIVCAGWDDEVNMEDTLFAGALIDKLQSGFVIKGDPAILAHRMYKQSERKLVAFLEDASHMERLLNLGLQRDIEFCLTLDTYDIVPVLNNGKIVSDV